MNLSNISKKFFAIIASVVLVLAGASLQTPLAKAQQIQGPPSNVCRINATYYAQCYGQWSSVVFTGFTGTGTQTMSMLYGYVTLPDGRPFVPFSTNVPLQVDVGSNAEVVTPSSVSGCAPLNPNQGVCQVTASFSNAHGNGTLVFSGDQGIEEAILDAQNAGGGMVFWMVDTGTVTLSTSGLTTTTTTKVPSVFSSFGATARVQTTITVTASWAVGITGSTSAFCTANSTLTAGTNCRSNMNSSTVVNQGAETALTAILFTGATSNPGAGAIKARVWGYTPVQPVS